jgi:predicted GTPase
MGYSPQQIAELAATIQATPCDTVLFGTPVDLRQFLTLHSPAVRVSYDLVEIGQPTLAAIIPLLTKRAGARLSWSLPRCRREGQE